MGSSTYRILSHRFRAATEYSDSHISLVMIRDVNRNENQVYMMLVVLNVPVLLYIV